MNTLPQDLPCFTTNQEYSQPDYFRELPRSCGYIRSPEQEAAYQADLEARFKRLHASLDEIFSSPEGQEYLNRYK